MRLEWNYFAGRRENFAIIETVNQIYHYLLARKFITKADTAIFTWMLSFKTPDGQVARWLERLHEYDFQIHHRSGSLHTNAESLSRRPYDKKSCKPCSSIEKLSCISLPPKYVLVATQQGRWKVFGPLNFAIQTSTRSFYGR